MTNPQFTIAARDPKGQKAIFAPKDIPHGTSILEMREIACNELINFKPVLVGMTCVKQSENDEFQPSRA
jgi:hypothetical protein